ncbi:hydrolase, carbon-nitrogen family protein [Aspergillus nomiae NRRL 13137]|uniref:Hydrolase, carbon-nitrogen family protein n=1 Tax=Aspergillus nomiae NRRL (strain ATCC 15546 / NRRL 13137 / CBS 260.88 / M93) TaxID=1509407 RepID=A0A0L1IMK7_ASPN3|nr:hydrolase, carbon-nitrogen family protein [Aspergillus nomiae NRRL 13137]KNG80722.1 hydrolase, carbon-nitrogen family protein [Aspergillus nomiae NRRL 13137]
MAPIHRIAVIQWHIKDLAMDENHQKACTYIREAASQGVKLAVLPEYHLNAFPPTNPLYLPQTDSQITTKYLQSYQALAKELNICIVPGTIVENHSSTSTTTSTDSTDPILYNTAYFISNDGSILASYRKKNIWHPERPYLTSSASDPHVAFDTPIGKVGLLICWDLAFPEAFRELIAAGAEMIVVPTFWTKNDASAALRARNPDCEKLFLESVLTARCFENTCGVVFANAAGQTEGDGFLGLSRVTMPGVGVVGSLGWEEGVCVVDVDMGLVRDAEENYRVREDLGREGWYYSYRHQGRD